MKFDPSSLNNFLLILAAWGGAFLAALWLSLLVWTYRDIRSRAKDPLVRILSVLVVAVLFLPGIVVYFNTASAPDHGRGIPAYAGRRSPAAGHRRTVCLSGLWTAHEGGLDRLSQLLYQVDEKLPYLRPADETALGFMPLLRHTGTWKTDRGALGYRGGPDCGY